MSLNKVILIGRLGRDLEVRYMPNGETVYNLSIATGEAQNDCNGQYVRHTEWHNITMYRRLAEAAGQYLRKGSQVYLEDHIQNRKYQGRDSIERIICDIIANETRMLGKRSDNSNGAPYDGGYQHQQNGYQQAQQQQCQSASACQQETLNVPPAAPRRQVPAIPTTSVENIDDNIPLRVTYI